MKTGPILIVTDELDRDADAILLFLREMGQEVVRVHTADFPLQSTLSSSYDGTDWSRTIATRKQTIQLDEVRSIWWRRPGPPTLPSELTDYERGFARDEGREGLEGLWESIEHECYWVSFPAAIKKAEHFERLLSTHRLPQQTILFISHRYSTVRRADRILVLEGERLIEEGSHMELMQQDGRYAHLFAAQMHLYTDEPIVPAHGTPPQSC